MFPKIINFRMQLKTYLTISQYRMAQLEQNCDSKLTKRINEIKWS